jgi:hypothetical protein
LLNTPGVIFTKASASMGVVLEADLNKGISTVQRVPVEFIDFIIALVITTNTSNNFISNNLANNRFNKNIKLNLYNKNT